MVRTFNPSTWETHTFNPSTREVETGRDTAGQREEYKVGRDRSSVAFWRFILSLQSEDPQRQDCPFGLSTGRSKNTIGMLL